MMGSSWLLTDAKEFEDDTWKLSGLDFDQFNAAAYYVSVVQAQQKKDRNTTQAFDGVISVDNTTNCENGFRQETIDLFLDLLALLFARFKKASRTPGSVTATGLVTESKRWEIWIAKNAGPYTNQVKGQGIANDKDFLPKLQTWLGGEPRSLNLRSGDGQPEEPHDPFWDETVEFWDERITHYVNEIQARAKLLSVRGAASHDEVNQDVVWDFLQNKTKEVVKAEFLKDWNRAIELTSHLKMASSEGRNVEANDTIPGSSGITTSVVHESGRKSLKLHFNAFEQLCQFQNRENRQIYPAAKGPKDDSHPFAASYRNFRTRINNLEMLGTPLTMWKVFNFVRKEIRSKEIGVNIEFVDAFPLFQMEKAKLAATITSWRGLEKSDHMFTDLQGLEQGEKKPFTRYFHCELQMLRLLLKAKAEGRAPHSYIGVSKLSCHFCWEIISNRKEQDIEFRTKEGHRQISANCAFPFAITAGYGYVPVAIAKLQASMLHNILREAVKLKNKYTAYSIQNNTKLDSIPGSFDMPNASSGRSQLEEPRFGTSDDIISIKALEYDIHGRMSLREVPLFHKRTLQPLHKGDTDLKNTTGEINAIPEPITLNIPTGGAHWCNSPFRFRGGQVEVFFEAYFRLGEKYPGNRWSYKQFFNGNDLKAPRLDDWLFRDDIWVFKVDLNSKFYYEHVDHQTEAERDYYEHQVPAMPHRWQEVERRNMLFWDKRNEDIEIDLVKALRSEYEPWLASKKMGEMISLIEESSYNPTNYFD